MRKLVLVVWLASGCAHAIRNVSDCGQVQEGQRLECGACLVQNKAEGLLGTWEYRPDEKQGSRCQHVK